MEFAFRQKPPNKFGGREMVFGMFDMFDIYKEQEKKEGSADSSYSGSVSSDRLFVICYSPVFKEKMDSTHIARFSNLINDLKREGYNFAIVVSAGKIGIDYKASAKSLGANAFTESLVELNIAKANAELLIHSLEESDKRIQEDISKARQIIDSGKIPVFASVLPGIPPQTIAALLAEYLNAVFVYLIEEDGIFLLSPKKFDKPKMIEAMSHERLMRFAFRESNQVIEETSIDAMTAFILNRSKTVSLILNANELDNMADAIHGSNFKGTVVKTIEEENV